MSASKILLLISKHQAPVFNFIFHAALSRKCVTTLFHVRSGCRLENLKLPISMMTTPMAQKFFFVSYKLHLSGFCWQDGKRITGFVVWELFDLSFSVWRSFSSPKRWIESQCCARFNRCLCCLMRAQKVHIAETPHIWYAAPSLCAHGWIRISIVLRRLQLPVPWVYNLLLPMPILHLFVYTFLHENLLSSGASLV